MSSGQSPPTNAQCFTEHAFKCHVKCDVAFAHVHFAEKGMQYYKYCLQSWLIHSEHELHVQEATRIWQHAVASLHNLGEPKDVIAWLPNNQAEGKAGAAAALLGNLAQVSSSALQVSPRNSTCKSSMQPLTASYNPSLQVTTHHCKLQPITASCNPSLQVTTHHCKLQPITASYNPSLQVATHHCISQPITAFANHQCNLQLITASCIPSLQLAGHSCHLQPNTATCTSTLQLADHH